LVSFGSIVIDDLPVSAKNAATLPSPTRRISFSNSSLGIILVGLIVIFVTIWVAWRDSGSVLHENRFKMPTSTLKISITQRYSTHGYASQRDTSNTVPVVRVVSADDMNTLRFTPFHIKLPSELDGALVRFGSGRQEYSVRKTPRAMSHQHLTEAFGSEIGKPRSVVIREGGHLLGNRLYDSFITMSNGCDSGSCTRIENPDRSV
jgi:hypothetical protein